MSTFNAGAIEANLTLDRTSWNNELKKVQQEIRDLENTSISIMIDVDKTNADIQLDNLENDLLVLERDPVGIDIDVNTEAAHLALDVLEGRLDALDIRRVTVMVDADVDNAIVQLGLVENDMDVLEADPVNINVDVDSAAAHAQLAELQAMVGLLDGKDINIDADVDRDFLNLIEGGGGGGGHLGLLRIALYSILALLPILSVATTSAVGAIGALAATLAAAGAATLVFAGGIALLISRFKDAKEAGTMTKEMERLNEALNFLNEALDEFYDQINKKGFNVMAHAVEIAAQALSGLAPVFNAAADAFEVLLDGIERFVEGPEFQKMIDFFADFGADMIVVVGQIIGNLLVFFGYLFKAFEPLARDMMDGLLDLTEAWVKWAKGLEDNEAFQDFINDVRTFGPMVLDFLGSMLAAFINLGEALEPFAGPMLKGLTEFFDFIANSDPEALSIAIGAIGAAFISWKVIPPLVSGFQALSGVLALISGPMLAVAAAVAILGLAFYDLWQTNEDFRNQFEETWNEINENIRPIIEDFTTFFREHWDGIKEWFTVFWDSIKELVFNFFDFLNGFIQLALEVIGFIWERWGEEIIGVVAAAFTAVGNNIRNFIQFISAIFKLLGDIMNGRWSNIWDDLLEIAKRGDAFFRGLWSNFVDFIKSILRLLWAVVSDGWNAVWSWAQDRMWRFHNWLRGVWDNLIDWFKRLPGRVGGAVAGIWDSLVEGFANAINAIIGYWNSLELTINIPDKIPGLPNEWTISTPDFPQLAMGGIVTDATLAMVGEGSEDEAVMPLSRLQEFVDNSRTEIDYGRLGSAVAAALANVLSRSGLSFKREDLELLASMLGIEVKVDARDDSSGRALASAIGFQLRLLGLGGKSNV